MRDPSVFCVSPAPAAAAVVDSSSLVTRCPLTCGQRFIWLINEATPAARRHVLNQHVVVRLDRDVSLAEIEHALHRLMERHAALRTRFQSEPGRPQQWVYDRSLLQMHTQSVRDGADARRRAFDLTAELPWRLSVDGRELYLIAHHVLIDGWAAGLLQTELTALLDRRFAVTDHGGEVPPAPGCDSDRQLRSTRHWRARWSEIASEPFARAGSGGQRPSYFVQAFADSAAALAAARRLSRACRVSDASAVLAAYFVTMSGVTGERDLTVVVNCGNRFDPGTRHLVANRNQRVWVTQHVGDRTAFADFAGRVHRDCSLAYEHGEYDWGGVIDAVVQGAVRTGTAFGRCVVLNWAPLDGGQLPAGGPDVGASTALRFDPQPIPRTDDVLDLDAVLIIRPEQTRMLMKLRFNPAALTETGAVAALQAVERVLAEAAARPDLPLSVLAARCGISRPVFDGSWWRAPHGWVHLDRTREALLAHPLVADCDLDVRDAAAGPRLVARLLSRGPTPPAHELRRHVQRCAMSGRGVAVPDAFVMPGTDSMDAGFEPPLARPSNPAAATLCAILGDLVGRPVSSAETLPQTGISANDMPALAARLGQAGWPGLATSALWKQCWASVDELGAQVTAGAG